MVIGQLSLASIPPDKREQFMQRWLEHAKQKVLDCFPNLGFVCGIHALPAQPGSSGRQTKTIELLCGSPFRRFIGQLVCESPDKEHWRVEMFQKSAFSGPILTWPGAVGASLGYPVGRAIHLALCTLFGWSKKSDWEYMQSALVQALSPAQVEAIAKEI